MNHLFFNISTFDFTHRFTHSPPNCPGCGVNSAISKRLLAWPDLGRFKLDTLTFRKHRSPSLALVKPTVPALVLPVFFQRLKLHT